MFDMMCSRRLVRHIHDNITAIATYPPFRVSQEDADRLLNLYYPSAKLLSKERVGVRTKKEYDAPDGPG